MRILIDIGHPAHVHYFKNFIWKMEAKGHEISIMARDKEVTFKLLDYFRFPYFRRGKGGKGYIGKLVYTFKADIIILRKALKVKPDLFLSFATPYAAHIAWLLRKPYIAFDDTDHNPFTHAMYVPFSSAILTPKFYLKNQGDRQIHFDSFMELCALHPNQFTPLNDKEENDSLKTNGNYIVLRFVSWIASHDLSLKGLSIEEKYSLVKELSKYVKVIISSESPLPEGLRQYAYSTHPALMHDLLKGASLLVSESLTMSAEAAFLGTPTLCISIAKAGTLNEQVRLGLIELFRNSNGLIDRAVEIATDKSFKEKFKNKSKEIVKTKLDLTSFMIWFVENYPDSFSIMKQNPDYQNRFK